MWWPDNCCHMKNCIFLFYDPVILRAISYQTELLMPIQQSVCSALLRVQTHGISSHLSFMPSSALLMNCTICIQIGTTTGPDSLQTCTSLRSGRRKWDNREAWSVSWLFLESCQLDRVSSVRGRFASSHLAIVVPCGPVFIVIPSAPSTDWYKQGSGVHPPHLTVCKYIGLYIIIMSANRSFPSLHSIRFRPSVTNSTLSANRCILSAAAAGWVLFLCIRTASCVSCCR